MNHTDTVSTKSELKIARKDRLRRGNRRRESRNGKRGGGHSDSTTRHRESEARAEKVVLKDESVAFVP